ncbi:MAG TPA: hypothetical protein VNX29_16035 [Kaistia sp.]|nr:hypothetical protein [Kaistia sp.]
MIEKTEYSEDEKQAAWEEAEPIPGEDPAVLRVDSVNNGSAVIYRDKFGSPRDGLRQPGHWLIDDQGRARHARYKFSDAISADRARADDAQKRSAALQLETNEVKASEAGLKNADILNRLDALEKAVAELQKPGTR